MFLGLRPSTLVGMTINPTISSTTKPINPTSPALDPDRLDLDLGGDLPDGIRLSTTRTGLWQGFSFIWRKDPHRLTHVASEVSGFADLLEDGRQGVRFRHRAALAVGDFPDRGDVVTFVTRIAGSSLHIRHGSTTMRLSGPIGQALRTTGAPIAVSIPGSVPSPLTAAAVVRGFSVDVVSRPDGYTTRGFGVGITAESLAGRSFQFRPTAFVRLDNVPDRPAQAGGQDVVYDITLHYSVLAAPTGKVNFVTTAPDPIDYTDEDTGPVPITHVAQGQGGGGFPHAAFAVRGFEWELDEVHPLRFDGRYVRLVHNYLATTNYAPASGQAACQVVRWYSNDGLVSLAFKATHQIDLMLVQLADDPAPVSGVLHAAVGEDIDEVTQTISL
jgi:hypothetical protein